MAFHKSIIVYGKELQLHPNRTSGKTLRYKRICRVQLKVPLGHLNKCANLMYKQEGFLMEKLERKAYNTRRKFEPKLKLYEEVNMNEHRLNDELNKKVKSLSEQRDKFCYKQTELLNHYKKRYKNCKSKYDELSRDF